MSEPRLDDQQHRESYGILLPILVVTMTASSYQIFALSVLAVDIIDDIGVSRTGLGLLGSLNTMVGALSAPMMGRLTDRIGAKEATVAILAISGLGMGMMALSGSWLLMGLSAIISGIPQGWGNPATNALIAERIDGSRRGTVTGIKQSGVQLGIFLAGLTLPGLALLIGWRGALMGYAIFYAVGAVVVAKSLGQPTQAALNARSANNQRTDSPALPSFIWLLSIYAFLFGAAGGAIGRFFPLWANEEVGLSTVVAGILVALGGLLGIGARIGAGQLAQSRIAPRRMLMIQALIGVVYCVLLILTLQVGAWILWPATILYALGIGSWNAVAMLAVIVSVPQAVAGRASGIVMLGFLGGLAISSPLAGAAVDRWDTYQPVWIVATVLSLASAALITISLDRHVERTAPAGLT
ncbi:MAG: MFS transporter [Acidimicrobiales bacterium]